jgi:Rieske Fe-S protein
VWRYLTPEIAARRDVVMVGKKEIPAQGALLFPESRLAVVRDQGNLYALKMVCTHLGCTVTVTPSGLICPCHGSLFDRSGQVVRGPAARPLERYKLEERGEILAIYL